MPVLGFEDPTAQSLVNNMGSLHSARTDTLSNIAPAQDKQRRAYATG